MGDNNKVMIFRQPVYESPFGEFLGFRYYTLGETPQASPCYYTDSKFADYYNKEHTFLIKHPWERCIVDLKDKNGALIYENDWVVLRNVIIDNKTYNEVKACVKWCAPLLSYRLFSWGDINDYLPYYYLNDKLEIIGNIHTDNAPPSL